MKHWQSVLIGPDVTLEEAIAVLDREALRIVLIVDESLHLLGTLTDGDVRRAILGRMDLRAPVRLAMCSTPRTARDNWNRKQILACMDRFDLLQIPVINDDNVVIGLENLHDLLATNQKDNPVFLMAGGFGKRLHPLTETCPKPLLKVGGKAILELILENFIAAGFHQFFISTHYMPEMIQNHFGDGKKWGVSIRYVHEDSPLGTGGALGLLPHDEIDLPLFVMNGDLLTTLNFQNLLDFHNANAGAATMCVREYEYCVPYGVIESQGHRITSMVEKPIQKFFINAGIYVLSPSLVRSVASGRRVDMPTLLEETIAADGDVNMFPVHEYWLDIGRMEDFNRAQHEFGAI